MKLVSIEIDGYKRFYTKQALHLDCRIVSLLGPNEAGKTSILKALESLGTKAAFRTDGPNQDVSRGRAVSSDHPIITAKFLLEDADRAALASVREAAKAKWCVVEKWIDGQRQFAVYPSIKRDIGLRNTLAEQMAADSDMAAMSPTLFSALTQTDSDTLPAETIDLLRTHLEAVLGTDYEKRPWASTASVLIENEKKEHPKQTAINILKRRMPRFISYGERHRDLAAQYDLRTFFADSQQVPESLANLADVANLSLQALFEAGQREDEGTVGTLELKANEKLKEKMNKAWGQSKVSVAFRLNNGILRILVQTPARGFESIAERSEGLRQFVALFALVERTRSADEENIVVLIDEAESHLHYDAQADLVQMLTKQQLADKIIYTTHSLGCLPEDLGTGIRLVQPTDDSNSEIVSKFWTTGSVGLSPILFGMGAATMTFMPIRYCVFTEGPTDFLLLPSILKYVIPTESLGYLIAPGLAEIGKGQIKLIRNEGKKVFYVVDGDESGTEILNMLKAGGVNEAEIIQLANAKGEGCVLEDFLSKEIYAAAVNGELARSQIAPPLVANDLPEIMRPTFVTNLLAQKEIKEPNKVDVAYRILEMMYDFPLLDPSNLSVLKEINAKISTHFSRKS